MPKIIEIRKSKQLYKVTFDAFFSSPDINKLNEEENTLYVTEDAIIKFRLSKNNDVTIEKIKEIAAFSAYSLGKNLAFYYISFKMRTKVEVINYLTKHNIPSDDITCIINELEIQKIIDDDTYVESFVHSHITLGKHGPYLIKQKLLKKGIEQDLIDSMLDQLYSEEEQMVIATKLAEKEANVKADRFPLKMLKIKIQQSLINKGFSYDIAASTLENLELTAVEENEKKLITQEAQKAYQRFKKRYNGYDLKNHIVQTLGRKGFNWDDISTALQDYDF